MWNGSSAGLAKSTEWWRRQWPTARSFRFSHSRPFRFFCLFFFFLFFFVFPPCMFFCFYSNILLPSDPFFLFIPYCLFSYPLRLIVVIFTFITMFAIIIATNIITQLLPPYYLFRNVRNYVCPVISSFHTLTEYASSNIYCD